MVGAGSKVSSWNYISHHASRPQGARLSLKPETQADPREPGTGMKSRAPRDRQARSRRTAEVPAPLNLAGLSGPPPGLIWPLALGRAWRAEPRRGPEPGTVPGIPRGRGVGSRTHLQVPREGDPRALR